MFNTHSAANPPKMSSTLNASSAKQPKTPYASMASSAKQPKAATAPVSSVVTLPKITVTPVSAANPPKTLPASSTSSANPPKAPSVSCSYKAIEDMTATIVQLTNQSAKQLEQIAKLEAELAARTKEASHWQSEATALRHELANLFLS